MAIAQNYPIIAPSLSLDFANVQALDPRITYTRASTATYYGTRTALAEQNLLLYSQEFDNAAWGKTGLTVTANSTAAPDGTTTADTLTGTSTSNAVVFNNAAVAATANTYTSSVFIKAGTADFGVLSIWTGSATNGANLWFNAQTGALTGSSSVTAGYTITASSSTALSAGWFRITVSATVPTANIYLSVRIVDTDNAFVYTSTVGKTLFIWGAQLEQRSTVTAYTPTTTQPVTNYIPVLETAASGVARFDHNPLTFESLGLLIEQQSTNLATQSQTFTTWVKSAATVTNNVAVAPDGTLTSSRLVPTATSSGHGINFASGLGSGTFTLSVYAKQGGYPRLGMRVYDGTAYQIYTTFDISNGTIVANTAGTATITPVGNGWYRCTCTGTSASGNMGSTAGWVIESLPADKTVQQVFLGDGYSGAYVWGAQIEAGTFSTSYIPTVASQVTRAADSASMTGTNFSSWYNQGEGTLYADFTISSRSDSPPYRGVYSLAVATCRLDVLKSLSGTQQVTRSIAVGRNREVAAFDGTAKTITEYINGANTASLTSVVSNNASSFAIGRDQAFNPLSGTIAKIAYYPIRLSNTNLQALTG